MIRIHSTAVLIASVLCMLWGHGVTYAQQSASEECKPWHCGVSEEDKANAQKSNASGVEAFEAGLLTKAEDDIRAALRLWPDNPGFHFNLMRLLTKLRRYREAYDHVEAALRYGPDGLSASHYQAAMFERDSLLGHLVRLEVVCHEPSAIVTRNKQVVIQGLHRTSDELIDKEEVVLVANKPGFLSPQKAISLYPGKHYRAECHMLEEEKKLVKERYWPHWQRRFLIAAGAGAGLALLGGFLHQRATVDNQAFHNLYALECPAGAGCFRHEYSSELASLERRSIWYRRIGYSATVVGGVALTTGAAFLLLNRPREIVNPQLDQLNGWTISKGVDIRATVTPTGASAAAVVRFD